MPKKVSVKPILELRAAGISMRKIETLMHVSRHTISAIYKAADAHSISWDNVKDFDDEYSGVAEPCFPLKEPPTIPVKRANLSANESQSLF